MHPASRASLFDDTPSTHTITRLGSSHGYAPSTDRDDLGLRCEYGAGELVRESWCSGCSVGVSDEAVKADDLEPASIDEGWTTNSRIILEAELYQEAEELCAAASRLKRIIEWQVCVSPDLREELEAAVGAASQIMTEIDAALRWEGYDALVISKPKHVAKAGVSPGWRMDLVVANDARRNAAMSACQELDGLCGLHTVDVAGAEHVEARARVREEVGIIRRRAAAVKSVAGKMAGKRLESRILSFEGLRRLQGLAPDHAVRRERAEKSVEHDRMSRLSPPSSRALPSAEDKSSNNFTVLYPSLSSGDATAKLVVAQENTPIFGVPSRCSSALFPLAAPPQQTLIPEAFNFRPARDATVFSALTPQRDIRQESSLTFWPWSPRITVKGPADGAPLFATDISQTSEEARPSILRQLLTPGPIVVS
jgi:hypothetical protein